MNLFYLKYGFSFRNIDLPYRLSFPNKQYKGSCRGSQ